MNYKTLSFFILLSFYSLSYYAVLNKAQYKQIVNGYAKNLDELLITRDEETFSKTLKTIPQTEFIQHNVFSKLVDNALKTLQDPHSEKTEEAFFILSNPLIKNHFQKNGYCILLNGDRINIFDSALQLNIPFKNLAHLKSLGHLPNNRIGVKAYNFVCISDRIKKDPENIEGQEDLQLYLDDIFGTMPPPVNALECGLFEGLLNLVFSKKYVQNFVQENPPISRELYDFTLTDIAAEFDASDRTRELLYDVDRRFPTTYLAQTWLQHHTPSSEC